MTGPWNGLPISPDEDGWHWLLHDEAGLAVAKWCALDECWLFAGDWSEFDPDFVAEQHSYLGKCSPPHVPATGPLGDLS